MPGKRMLFVGLLAFLVPLGGCTSYKAVTLESRSVDSYVCLATVEAVSVAADPYDSAEKAQQAFYADVNQQGFFPINVIIKNDCSERVLFLKETAQLVDINGGVYKPVSSRVMYNDFEHNKIAYALLGFGIFSYMSAEEANRKMEADWREKEISDQLVVPEGRRANGVLYFKLPSGKALKGNKLSVDLEKLESKKIIHFDVQL
jgi:hypothetical protein